MMISCSPVPDPSDNLPFTVLFTGTFIPLHGIEYIINAAKILEQRGEAIRFVIVGAGQSYQKITAMASELAVSNVQFERPVRYEQLSHLMLQAHLCLGIFGTSAKAATVPFPEGIFRLNDTAGGGVRRHARNARNVHAWRKYLVVPNGKCCGTC